MMRSLLIFAPLVVADLPIHCEEPSIVGTWKIYVQAAKHPSLVGHGNCGHSFPNSALSMLEAQEKLAHTKPEFEPLATVKLAEDGRMELDQVHEEHDLASFLSMNSTHSFSWEELARPPVNMGVDREVDSNERKETTWSPIYDEGMELRFPKAGTSLFAYFKFTPENESLRKEMTQDSYYGEDDEGKVDFFKSDCGSTMLGWGNVGREALPVCWYGVREKAGAESDNKLIPDDKIDSSSDKQFYEAVSHNLEADLKETPKEMKSVQLSKGKRRPRILSPFPIVTTSTTLSRHSSQFASFPVPEGSLGPNMEDEERKEMDHEARKKPIEDAAEVEVALNTNQAEKESYKGTALDKVDIPENFDWHTSPLVFQQSPVLNQGQCGSCYAIASLFVVESRFRLAFRKAYGVDYQIELSPESVVSCSETAEACNGGFPFLVGRHGKNFGFRQADCITYIPTQKRNMGFASYAQCMAGIDRCQAKAPRFFEDKAHEDLEADEQSANDIVSSMQKNFENDISFKQGTQSEKPVAFSSSEKKTTKHKDNEGILTKILNYFSFLQLGVGPASPNANMRTSFSKSPAFMLVNHPEKDEILSNERDELSSTSFLKKSQDIDEAFRIGERIMAEEIGENEERQAWLAEKERMTAAKTIMQNEEIMREYHSNSAVVRNSHFNSLRDGVRGKRNGDDSAFPVYDYDDDRQRPIMEREYTSRHLHNVLSGMDFFVKDYGYVGGYYGGCNEKAMLREVYLNGPVVVAAEIPDSLMSYTFDPADDEAVYSPGKLPASHVHYASVTPATTMNLAPGNVTAGTILKAGSSAADAAPAPKKSQKKIVWEDTTHAMVVVGFGITPQSKQKFWTVRNSWGKEFGDAGYFRWERGTNAGAIEHQAVWFQPDLDRVEQHLGGKKKTISMLNLAQKQKLSW